MTWKPCNGFYDILSFALLKRTMSELSARQTLNRKLQSPNKACFHSNIKESKHSKQVEMIHLTVFDALPVLTLADVGNISAHNVLYNSVKESCDFYRKMSGKCPAAYDTR